MSAGEKAIVQHNNHDEFVGLYELLGEGVSEGSAGGDEVQCAEIGLVWDDDEPPTTVQPHAMFDVPSLTEGQLPNVGPRTAQTNRAQRHGPVLPLNARPSTRVDPPSHRDVESQRGENHATAYPLEGLLRSLAQPQSRQMLRALVPTLGVLGLLVLGVTVRACTNVDDVSASWAISPEDAHVQVDGIPLVSNGTAILLTGLSDGPHEIVASRAGYEAYRSYIEVKGGRITKLPALALSKTFTDVGFAIASVPTGAAVILDGVPTGQLTPARITGVKEGLHQLTLKHDGYVDYSSHVLVPSDSFMQLPAAELTASPASVKEQSASKRPLP
jgi:hypothetical protein